MITFHNVEIVAMKVLSVYPKSVLLVHVLIIAWRLQKVRSATVQLVLNLILIKGVVIKDKGVRTIIDRVRRGRC